MGYLLVLNGPAGGERQYFSTDDYEAGVVNRKWTVWKRMFVFYYPFSYVFASEAEAKDVMRCLGNFAPHYRTRMRVVSKESVDQMLIQKVLGLDA